MSADVYEIECVVAGAGVVGLACAAALAARGREVLLIEAADGIGTGVSSRNSEVIHAGIYYPTGSWRHRLCVAGRRKLYDYLAARGVGHRKCGKLIVATNDDETAKLAKLYDTARANDVEGIAFLGGAEACAMEPNLRATAALISPETGIVDSHGLMLALQGDLENAGGMIAFSSPLIGGALTRQGVELRIGGASPATLRARHFINAAGLGAQQVAHLIEGFPKQAIPPLVLAKGNYFGCAGKPAFSRLIYPAPVDGGLGVHLTIDLGGRMRFGPDVEWLDDHDPAHVDYNVNPARSESFYAAIRRYWPDLPDGALQPDYSGCRPKLSGAGAPAADFRIDAPSFHGAAGVTNLFGIESPGLTSALAIAEIVADIAEERAMVAAE